MATNQAYNQRQLYAIKQRYREMRWEKTEWGQQRKEAIEKSRKLYTAKIRTIENKRLWNIERKRAIRKSRKDAIKHRARFAITCGAADAQATIFPLTCKYTHGQIISQAGAKVAMAIVELSKTTGDIWASAKTIAKYAGVTERTAQAWRHKFEELKILTVEMWGGIDIRTGAKLTNHDRVNFKRLVAWIKGAIDDVPVLDGRMHYSASPLRHIIRGKKASDCGKTKSSKSLNWDFSDNPFNKLLKPEEHNSDAVLAHINAQKKIRTLLWSVEDIATPKQLEALNLIANEALVKLEPNRAISIVQKYAEKIKKHPF